MGILPVSRLQLATFVMRVGCMMAILVAGCSFDVIGTTVGDPSGGSNTPSSPTQSVPSTDDAGAPATQPPAPPTTPPPADMAEQRVGTACTDNAHCDPGLICAKSFGVGPGHVDVPGGYCTLDCSKTACPADSVCVTFTFGKYCESTCPPDPCRTGYTCCDVGDGDTKACTPGMLCKQG